MAGYRRRHGKQYLHDTRQQRRRRSLDAKLAAASTPSERVTAAADYLRGALKHANPAAAERTAGDVVRVLTEHASRLLHDRKGRAA